MYKIISHEINTLYRRKRGLINFVGDAFKWLFGTPDAGDAQFYSDSINQIINNEKQTEVLMQRQVSIISQTISNFNNSIRKMNENIKVLDRNLQNFNRFSNEIKTFKEKLDFEMQLSNHMILLIEMTDEIQSILQNYVNDISLLQHGIINYRILAPEILYKELQKISTKYNLPIPLTIENTYLYYKLINLKSFIKNKILIISFELPISLPGEFTLYQIFSLPNPHKEDSNIYSFIQPSKPYILLSTSRTLYILLENIQNCLEYAPTNWLCNSLPTLKKTTNEECEVQLLMKTTTTIPRTCQTRNLIADLQIWHRLQDNKWFYATSKPTQISIVCSKEDSITQVIKRSGIIRLDSTCQAYTDQVTLHSQRILPGHNLTNEIPVTDITEDDCCKKLKRNISVNAIYMEPLKLTNLDLNELKYAQEKLNQFDEQLQQQLNKPFIVKQSHWYTTIISVITVLIILLILYKLLRFFGCVQYLRRCRK